MSRLVFIISFLVINIHSHSQVIYPYPVKEFKLTIEGKNVNMAYMDIKPSIATASKNILLLHGKNFNGYYWKELIPLLIDKGYRVIVPDQVGWGQSDRINLHYSFHMLAYNTKQLLQSLGIDKFIVLGHSMGGMLAIRLALAYPESVEKLILENPIGLEDYKTFVPYQSIDSLFQKERVATFESYKKYQQSYYTVWKPAYEQYVLAQAVDLKRNDFDTIALINAITYQMIYEQPVCYELSRIKVPTLLVIGQADRTVVGKDRLTEANKNFYGNYPVLGKITQEKIRGSVLKSIEAVGHIPHIENTQAFWKSIEDWLN